MGLTGPGMLSRRDFINGTIGAGVLLAAQGARTAKAQMNTRKRTIVDAQVHLWKAESPDWPWVPGRQPQLPEPFTIEKLVPLMDEAGVDRVVVVPPSWPGDRNDYGLEAARLYPNRFHVMGRIPLKDPSAAARLPKWREQPGMLGVRVTFLGPAAAWLTDGTADWFWPAALLLGHRHDQRLRPRDLPAAHHALHRAAAVPDRERQGLGDGPRNPAAAELDVATPS